MRRLSETGNSCKLSANSQLTLSDFSRDSQPNVVS
jgi:hypothetical protein